MAYTRVDLGLFHFSKKSDDIFVVCVDKAKIFNAYKWLVQRLPIKSGPIPETFEFEKYAEAEEYLRKKKYIK